MGYENYKTQFYQQEVNSASPLKLVIMLYDGADRFLTNALISMRNREYNAQNENLQKAQRILLELMSTLDMDQGGEISKNLLALYTYCVNQLVEANIYDQEEPIKRVQKIMGDLKSSWVAIEDKVRPAASGDQLAA